MREEKEIGDLFHPVSCISVGQPAGMDHTQLLSADQSPGCWIPPGLSPRRESQGWQGLGLVHRYSGRKAGWKWGTAPSTWKTTSPSPGTRKYCTQPTQWTTLEPSLQQEKKKCWVWCFTKHGSEELQELQAPTMAHCATHNKHLASCAVICGQTLALVATELWQRPKGKGQTMGAETKLDQLIHANLFRSFWCQHDQP